MTNEIIAGIITFILCYPLFKIIIVGIVLIILYHDKEFSTNNENFRKILPLKISRKLKLQNIK